MYLILYTDASISYFALREVHLGRPSRCWRNLAGSRERVLVTVEVGWGSLETCHNFTEALKNLL